MITRNRKPYTYSTSTRWIKSCRGDHSDPLLLEKASMLTPSSNSRKVSGVFRSISKHSSIVPVWTFLQKTHGAAAIVTSEVPIIGEVALFFQRSRALGVRAEGQKESSQGRSTRKEAIGFLGSGRTVENSRDQSD